MKTSLILGTSLALGLSLSAWGQNAPANPAGGAGSLPPMLTAFDTDKDGTLSTTEINGATAALLKLDTNGDGKIEPGEFCPAGGRGWGLGLGRGAAGCPGALALFDTDKDGSISAAEAQAAPAALKALDTDGDGKVSGGGVRPRRGRGGCPWAGRGGCQAPGAGGRGCPWAK